MRLRLASCLFFLLSAGSAWAQSAPTVTEDQRRFTIAQQQRDAWIATASNLSVEAIVLREKLAAVDAYWAKWCGSVAGCDVHAPADK